MTFLGLLLAPVKGLAAVAERLKEAAEKELDPGTIRDELLELQLAYEMGEVDEAEYEASYQALMERLANLEPR